MGSTFLIEIFAICELASTTPTNPRRSCIILTVFRFPPTNFHAMRLDSLLLFALFAPLATAAEFERNGHTFTLPDGLRIERVAGPPMVDRPVSADFDEKGRLYVTDSSGSNEAVEIQREKRPHRIVRLLDSDGDGTFDQRTVYADQLMFPEGAMWHDGSLYVAAPPEIWKFTDADDDGVAEHREIWFDGKTLTHCANDLHGPYLGRDGWIYWCKGAFADQTYQRPGKPDFETRAAHIFRRRPEGGLIEHVMTGGMDNPVEVVFTPGGERVFTTTFLMRPEGGHRDGLIHAIYGGVYGKTNGALDNHPRTGQLMPVMDHLGIAAPCGLAIMESDGLGQAFRGNLVTALFNMHKITRHVLTPQGATFASETSDLLVSDNLDFHPTDVVEDADGSLIVIDTGGWFRLCCPTSQLEKPDIMGGIYRIRREDGKPVVDPRGLQIAWDDLDETKLTEFLQDNRFAVRKRASQRLVKRGASAVASLRQSLKDSGNAAHRLESVWALTGIDAPQARKAVRLALSDSDETVRQAALHSVSVHRDQEAAATLATMIADGSPHNRRAAAESLGRVGASSDVSGLLSAVPAAVLDDGEATVDRVLEHSLIYAAMEIGDAKEIRKLIHHANVTIQRAALIALDQMDGNDWLVASDIQPLLVSDDIRLSETAWWIAGQHLNWGDAVVTAFTEQLSRPKPSAEAIEKLRLRLQKFSASPEVRSLMAGVLEDENTGQPVRLAVLQAMAKSGQKPLPKEWAEPLRKQLQGSEEVVRAALSSLSALKKGILSDGTRKRLAQIANDEQIDAETRLRALNLDGARKTTPAVFDFVVSQLDVEAGVIARALAVDFIKYARLNQKQLQQVARQLPQTGVMELRPLMAVFAKSKDQQVGMILVESLLQSPAATSLIPSELSTLLSPFGESVVSQSKSLLEKIEQESRNKNARIEEILALMPRADVRRGLKVFQSTKASCIACHQRGNIGGKVGPELNGIGKIRSERDLLESILFPSLSFVRSYESVTILTDAGRVISGLVREENKQSITLQVDAQKTVKVPTETIEERHFGTVSVMPAGLEKQLSKQELADLVLYLKQDL